MSKGSNRAVALWLFACCVFVYLMILVGGVTRLTHSGLSMVNWDPIMGVIPPLTEDEWKATFDQYKLFPEFQKVNTDMELSGFKKIFYMEYAHRVLGRMIGLIFFLPLVFFWLRGHIRNSQLPRLLFIFALGGLQGLLGWYMVKSGLVDVPSVSQYRLTAHLLLAVAIYVLLLWTGLRWWLGPRVAMPQPGWEWFYWCTVALLLIMITSGGFVAGTRAGFVYNTFPLMAGQWIPQDLWGLSPGWRNLFENVVTIQFLHRYLALLVAICVGILSVHWLRSSLKVGIWPGITVAALVGQLFLGITTLINQVPITLAVAHQAGAIALLTVCLVTIYLAGRIDYQKSV